MKYLIKDKLPKEGKLVKVWCSDKDGNIGWGEYKILLRDGITIEWCNRYNNIAPELIDEWKPESWEEQ